MISEKQNQRESSANGTHEKCETNGGLGDRALCWHPWRCGSCTRPIIRLKQKLPQAFDWFVVLKCTFCVVCDLENVNMWITGWITSRKSVSFLRPGIPWGWHGDVPALSPSAIDTHVKTVNSNEPIRWWCHHRDDWHFGKGRGDLDTNSGYHSLSACTTRKN